MTVPAKTKREAVELVTLQGVSYRDVAEALGVTHTSVRRWVKEARDAPPASPEAPAPASPPPDAAPEAPGPPEGADALTFARWFRDDALRLAREARAAGHFAAAQSFTRQAGLLMPGIARLEREHAHDESTVRYSRAEIDEAMRRVRERIAALLARPLLCARCSRELSASFGPGPEHIADARQEDHTETPAKSRGV